MNGQLAPVEVVRAYAAAKSAGDVTSAFGYCHPDVVVETIPFRSVSRGREKSRAHAAAFLRAFPDYDVELEELRAMGDLVVGAGLISATMEAPLMGLTPTRRRFRLPFSCLWYVRDALIVVERFFFDLPHMSEQLGLELGQVAEHLRVWQNAQSSRSAASRDSSLRDVT